MSKNRTTRRRAARSFGYQFYRIDVEEESLNKSDRRKNLEAQMEGFMEEQKTKNPRFSSRRFKKEVIDCRDSFKQLRLKTEMENEDEWVSWRK